MQTSKTFRGLNFRILRIMLPLMLVLLLMFFLVYQRLSYDIINSITKDYIDQKLIYNQTQVLQTLLREIALARNLAQSQSIIDWTLDEDNLELKTKAFTKMESLRKIFHSGTYFYANKFSANYYLNDHNNTFKDNQLRYTMSPEDEHARWFYETLKKPEECQLNVDHDYELGGIKVWINCQIKYQGEVIGLVGTGIEMTDFINSVVETSEEGVTHIFIDSSGAIKAHPNMTSIDLASLTKKLNQRRTIFADLDNPEDIEILRSLMIRLKADPGIKTLNHVYTVNGKESQVGLSYIREIDWYNLTVVDLQSWKPTDSFSVLFLFLVIAVAIISMVSIWLIHHLIVARLLNLDAAVKKIKQNFYALDLRDDADDEIANLTMHIVDMAKAIKLHQQQVIEQKERAEQANRAKSQFLANMSHEIRTPLNASIGFLDVLHTLEQTPEQHELSKGALAGSKHLLALINDILDFSKIEDGSLRLESRPVAIHSLLRDQIINQLFPLAEKKQLVMTADIAEEIPEYVFGDEMRLTQIFINLLGNAIKFTEFGIVTVTVKLLPADANYASIYFEVSDTGIGIPEEKQKDIFDKFTQSDDSHTRRYGGTGLGLSIAYNLVAMMGGELKLESGKEQGSRFFFELKMPVVSDDQIKIIKSIQQNERKESKQDFSVLRVLLVEDNEINQIAFEAMLTNLGVHVEIANDGAEAVDIIQRRAKDFDLILMDMQMPVMDGIKATSAIRRNPEFNEIPIVALTANVQPEDKEACFQAGMNDFLSKPLRLKVLKHVLTQVIEGAYKAKESQKD